MRLLVTIPHYCRLTPGGRGHYGSEQGDVEARRQHLERAILALHQTFGMRQALLTLGSPVLANPILNGEITIVVVTSGDEHALPALPDNMFRHHPTDVDPMLLGFVCHQILRESIGQFDHYAYLEDDIEITDPLFFQKLAWFNDVFGQLALLQPNRFELSTDLNVLKLYVDGNTTKLEIPAQFQDVSVRPRLVGGAFGKAFVFERVNNVHAGCFFLNNAQLTRVAASPMFGEPTSEFFGPLESAATLMIMRAFDVYKPARENAGFLELRHLGKRFLYSRTETPAEPEPEPAAPEPTPDIPAPPSAGAEQPPAPAAEPALQE